MQIKQIINNDFAKEWDDFVMANSSPASFLQSWKYGENSVAQTFRSAKKQILRLAVFDDSKLIAVTQFFKIALPGGKFYLDCKRGPIFDRQQNNKTTKQQILKLIISEIEKSAKKEKIIFFRVALNFDVESCKSLVVSCINPKILTNLMEPKKSLVLNLEKSEDEILAGMKQKTRYNIRLAEKKGVKISNFQFSIFNETAKQKLDEFYKLMQETAKRDGINIFDKEYYKSLLLTPYSLLLIAEYEGQILSGIILYTFGDTCTYFYGASSDKKRNLMPNHLIQWQAIKWAKKQGYKWYDFWGISENKNKWTGITKFKFGFVSEETGREINYNVNDFVLNKKWYNLYRIGKIIQSLCKLK